MTSKRSFGHWTPRYLMDRITQKWWMRRYPSAPWLSRQAVMFIEQWLRPDDQAFEWGSGRSTAWIAARVLQLRSVEHHAGWYQSVTNQINKQGLSNVDYILAEQSDHVELDVSRYSQATVSDVAEESLDFVLVDGILRDYCALAVLEKLKPGGLLVIDDAHRYLPSSSRSPFAIPSDGRCSTSRWEQLLAEVCTWRRIWFSDGIHDDAIFSKPAFPGSARTRRQMISA